jgi:hypothetical protein
VDFGEDDANLDYELAQRRSQEPIFIQAFLDYPQFNLPALKTGEKYLVLGQKGTGKTAILRKIESEFQKAQAITQFMIFRDEIASKEELEKFGNVFAIKVNDVKRIYHYLYTLERILLLVILSSLQEVASEASERLDPPGKTSGDQWEAGFIHRMVTKVVRQPLERVVQTALDTVSDYVSALSIDPARASRGLAEIDADVLLRKQNERLLNVCLAGLRKAQRPVKIFIDEVHYTYRIGKDHDQDASLVRDLIRVIARLNRTFSRERVDCTLYAAIRSEFLIHPLISAAELHPTLDTFGIQISWATYPADFSHPMFEIGAKRVDIAANQNFDGRKFMHACFANYAPQDATEFVRSTWSKPRDMVRFLRTCKEMYPQKITLSKTEYAAVFHAAAIKAWKEIETALTSFLSMKGVERLTVFISENSSQSLGKGSIGTIDEVLKKLAPIAKNETQVGAMSDPATLFRLLYMIGVMSTVRQDSGQLIIHSYHRGQVNPDPAGRVAIHRGVAKSFS